MNEKGLKIAVKGTLWKLKKAEDNESRGRRYWDPARFTRYPCVSAGQQFCSFIV